MSNTHPQDVRFRTEGRGSHNIIGSYGPVRSAEVALPDGMTMQVFMSTDNDGRVNGRTATVRFEDAAGHASAIEIVDGRVRQAYRYDGGQRVQTIAPSAEQARELARRIQDAGVDEIFEATEIASVSSYGREAIRAALVIPR